MSELERFERAAGDAGAAFVEVMLVDPVADPQTSVGRFHHRDDGMDPWHPIVRQLVMAEGGDEQLLAYHHALREVVAARPATRVVPSPAADPETTYRDFLAALEP